MNIIKIELDGQFAFFKNPEVNSNLYFTYNNIHKIAIMGILGSTMGFKGYNQQLEDDDYPEFYEKLKDLKIAVVPNGKVCPDKKIQVFNNSTMFHNKGSDGNGANLIVYEEWIEKPSWTIYLLLDKSNEIEEEMIDRLINNKYVYVPYLGKNDHFANISNVEVFKGEDYEEILTDTVKLDSFYLAKDFSSIAKGKFYAGDAELTYTEYLPTALTKETNHYILQKVKYSTEAVKRVGDVNVYKVNDHAVVFI